MAAATERLPLPPVERVRLWNRELLEELLPEQEEPGVPVILACDDETLRTVGERVGCDGPEAASLFAQDVKMAFDVGLLAGFKNAVRGSFDTQPRPRPLPDFFGLLCLWVLAASRMGADEKYPTSEFYGRLNALINVRGDDMLPCFNFIQPLFERLADWLADDVRGSRGILLLPENAHPKWVGLAVSQTVFRARDREVLTRFFSARMPKVEGFDPLRRLRRWPGRHQLTSHALRLLEDDGVEERVRAAIRAAHRAWDGSELVVTPSGFGRLWPANIHLLPHPAPRLHLGAANTKALEVELGGEPVVLEPGAEIEFPWPALDDARQRSLQLGDARSAAGGIRVPQLGDTVLFELGEDGLLRVEQPASETVWVLTRDGGLQERLSRRRLNDRGALPQWWQLYREVPLEELPNVERAPAPGAQEPIRLAGGLPVGRSVYLSGFGPLLEAGELQLDEDEWLPVRVNKEQIGLIGSGERVPLRADQPGTYHVAVGDGEFTTSVGGTTSYDVEPAGEPEDVGVLVYSLEGVNALRAGARPAGSRSAGAIVCGAAVSLGYSGELPILTRSATALATIDQAGDLATHDPSATPAWFAEVGLDEAGRWEIFRPDVVWLISPQPRTGRPWVRQLQGSRLQRLSVDAARLVAALGADPALSTRLGDCDEARRTWAQLVEDSRSAG